jgi:hypothetical protein
MYLGYWGRSRHDIREMDPIGSPAVPADLGAFFGQQILSFPIHVVLRQRLAVHDLADPARIEASVVPGGNKHGVDVAAVEQFAHGAVRRALCVVCRRWHDRPSPLLLCARSTSTSAMVTIPPKRICSLGATTPVRPRAVVQMVMGAVNTVLAAVYRSKPFCVFRAGWLPFGAEVMHLPLV